jgi:hypothetical protein
MRHFLSKTLDRFALQLLLWFEKEPNTERIGKFGQFEFGWRRHRREAKQIISRG